MNTVWYWIGYVGALALVAACVLTAVFYIGRSILRALRGLSGR